MRLFTYFFPALLGVIIMSSCSTQRSIVRTAEAAESKITQKTLVADVKVDVTKKLSGNGVSLSGNEEEAKNLANWNALAASDATILIDPVYTTTRTGKVIACYVTGYHGVYEKIETATEEDLLNFIRFTLLSGTGILSVSFDQFSAYYYKLIVEEGDEIIMTEDELRLYYDEQVKIAEDSQKSLFQPKQKDANSKKGAANLGKVALGGFLIGSIIAIPIVLFL